MPTITIDSGKLTKDQKRELIKVFTKKMTEITNVPERFTTVIIREHEDENIGVSGETVADLKKGTNNSK